MPYFPSGCCKLLPPEGDRHPDLHQRRHPVQVPVQSDHQEERLRAGPGHLLQHRVHQVSQEGRVLDGPGGALHALETGTYTLKSRKRYSPHDKIYLFPQTVFYLEDYITCKKGEEIFGVFAMKPNTR